jgi:cell division protein FtsN
LQLGATYWHNPNMAERESQFVTVSRQGIIAVTAVGVGLLTFCFVIGVQVGKKNLTQKNFRAKTIDDEINELPEPLDVQLQIFESIESNPTVARNTTSRLIANTPETDPLPAAASSTPALAEPARQQPNTSAAPPPPNSAANAPQSNTVGNNAVGNAARPNAPPASGNSGNTGERWTVQVAALSDGAGATRLSEQLKSQGFPAKIVISGGLHKVQLDWSGSKADANSRISSLQIRGHGAAFAVRIQ